jgi:probable F420-dependent oxidoreductase
VLAQVSFSAGRPETTIIRTSDDCQHMARNLEVGIRPVSWVAAEESFAEIVDWVERAERQGFDSVHMGDRLLAKAPPAYDSTDYEVTTSLSTFGARTDSTELGTLIFVVPFRHPIHVAKVFGTMDIATEGRVILGVGTGWNPHEFDCLGVDKSMRGQALEEGVEAVKQLWTEDHVDYDGEVYSFENATVEPKPLQEPHPPIWFASFGPELADFSPLVERALRRVGRLADGWVPITYSAPLKRMITADELEEAWGFIADSAEKEGRDPEQMEIVYSHWTFVMEDEAAEKDRCTDALDMWFDGSYEDAKDTYLIGTAEEVADTIVEKTADLPRVDRVVFTPFNYDHEQMDRLSEDVVPLLEDRL